MRFNEKTFNNMDINKIDISKKAKEDIEYLFAQIDSVNIDDIKNEEVHLRLGNKVFKLVNIGDVDESYIESKIKEEYRAKLSEKLNSIKKKINRKLNEMSEFVATLRDDFDKREKKLKAELASVVSMPDVTESHARKGLSVVKGSGKNRLVWLVQGVYWPKFLDHKPIDPEFSTRMITPITIQIHTNGTNISSVSIRKPIGLSKFDHYHSRGESGSDCWGAWQYSKNRWKTPDDIIKIGHEAQAVLENINLKSLGLENPKGLPRISTIKRNLLQQGDELNKPGIKRKEKRIGITPQESHFDTNIWTT